MVVKELSIAPNNIVGITTICNGNSTTLSLSGGHAGTGAMAEWFADSCVGTPIGTGNSISVSPTANTSYFVRYNGDCNITACASVNVMVNLTYTATTTISKHGCYTWPLNNTSYTLSGVYTITNTTINGCDSNQTLHLTIVPAVYLSGKVLLAGPYDVGMGLMHDSLRKLGLIPLLEPYSASPYLKTPIGEVANETLNSTVLLANGSNSIVDWILLEIRDAMTSAIILAHKRALLQRDGDIVSVDGFSPLEFLSVPSGNYFISVKHRNHIGAMTTQTVNLNGCSIAMVDFTNNSLIYSNSLLLNGPLKAFGPVFALWSGDANHNKNVKYNGLSSDKDVILTSLGGPSFINGILPNVYRSEDVNMDGIIKYNNANNDRLIILNNVGVSTPNQVLHQHTPN